MTLPVAVVVAIIGCVLAVSANVTTNEIHKDLEEERYKRIAAEQLIQKSQNRIKQLESTMINSQQKLDAIAKIFDEGRTTTADLETKLQSVTQEKEMLKKQIQLLQTQMKKIQETHMPAAPAQ